MSQLEVLVNDLIDTQAAMEPLKLKEADLKARIREECATPGKYEAGSHTVSVSETKRLDLGAVAEKFPVADYPQLYVLVPDTKKVRANLAPADLEPLMTVSGEPRMSIK